MAKRRLLLQTTQLDTQTHIIQYLTIPTVITSALPRHGNRPKNKAGVSSAYNLCQEILLTALHCAWIQG